MRFTMLAMGLGLLFTTTASADAPRTRENLLAAYVDDVNAHARYTAYAEQADREGYPQAARLFRATAQSEMVRAMNHAHALRRLGGEPSAEVGPFAVESTRANLAWTLARESAERGFYPRLAEQARRDGLAEAVLEFTLDHAVQGDVVKLYQEALRRPGSLRSAGGELHVCGVCGHVAEGDAPHRCPVSLSPGEAYARVD